MSRPSPPTPTSPTIDDDPTLTRQQHRKVRFNQLPSSIPLLNNNIDQQQQKNKKNKNDIDDDEQPENWSFQKMNSQTIKVIWKWIWFLGAGTLSFLFLRSSLIRWIFNLFGRHHRRKQQQQKLGDETTSTTTKTSSSLIDDLFESPFLDDNEELRLRPVSVNTYVYVMPTHQNEDGIFVKLLIENTSELATE